MPDDLSLSLAAGQRQCAGRAPQLGLVAGSTVLESAASRRQLVHGYTLMLTIAGAGQVRDGKEEFIAPVGQLLLLPPEAVHDYRAASGDDGWSTR